MGTERTGMENLASDEFAAVHRALADPKRFAIFQQIAGATHLPCGCLEAHGHLSPATISHHIKELQEAGLVESVREGRGVRLSIRRDRWNAYLQVLARL